MHRTTAIRVADLMHEENLKQKIGRIVTERNKIFKALYDAPPLDWQADLRDIPRLRPAHRSRSSTTSATC